MDLSGTNLTSLFSTSPTTRREPGEKRRDTTDFQSLITSIVNSSQSPAQTARAQRASSRTPVDHHADHSGPISSKSPARVTPKADTSGKDSRVADPKHSADHSPDNSTQPTPSSRSAAKSSNQPAPHSGNDSTTGTESAAPADGKSKTASATDPAETGNNAQSHASTEKKGSTATKQGTENTSGSQSSASSIQAQGNTASAGEMTANGVPATPDSAAGSSDSSPVTTDGSIQSGFRASSTVTPTGEPSTPPPGTTPVSLTSTDSVTPSPQETGAATPAAAGTDTEPSSVNQQASTAAAKPAESATSTGTETPPPGDIQVSNTEVGRSGSEGNSTGNLQIQTSTPTTAASSASGSEKGTENGSGNSTSGTSPVSGDSPSFSEIPLTDSAATTATTDVPVDPGTKAGTSSPSAAGNSPTPPAPASTADTPGATSPSPATDHSATDPIPAESAERPTSASPDQAGNLDGKTVSAGENPLPPCPTVDGDHQPVGRTPHGSGNGSISDHGSQTSRTSPVEIDAPAAPDARSTGQGPTGSPQANVPQSGRSLSGGHSETSGIPSPHPHLSATGFAAAGSGSPAGSTAAAQAASALTAGYSLTAEAPADRTPTRQAETVTHSDSTGSDRSARNSDTATIESFTETGHGSADQSPPDSDGSADSGSDGGFARAMQSIFKKALDGVLPGTTSGKDTRSFVFTPLGQASGGSHPVQSAISSIGPVRPAQPPQIPLKGMPTPVQQMVFEVEGQENERLLVRLSYSQNGVRTQFISEHQATQQHLQQNIPIIRHHLESAGVKVLDLNIGTSADFNGDTSRWNHPDNRQPFQSTGSHYTGGTTAGPEAEPLPAALADATRIRAGRSIHFIA